MVDLGRFRGIFDLNRPLLPFIMIIVAMIGVFTGELFEIPNAKIYSIFITASFTIFFLITFFIKENSDKVIKYPFSFTALQSVLFFFLGVIVILIINFASSIQTFEVIPPFAVFTTADITPTTTLNVIKLAIDPGVIFFYTIFVAGVMETWIFNFVGTLTGLLISRFARQHTDIISSSKLASIKSFDYIVAFLFASILFMVSHSLNGTYGTFSSNPSAYLVAGLFLMITNFLLFYFNVGFMFVVGLHMANNAAAIGWGNTLVGLTSGNVGFVFLAILVLISVFAILNFKDWGKALNPKRWDIGF